MKCKIDIEIDEGKYKFEVKKENGERTKIETSNANLFADTLKGMFGDIIGEVV